MVFARGERLAVRAFRVAARGRWRVELRGRGYSKRATIAVGVRALTPKRPPPTLLATGDSTMEPLASFLSDELGDDARVVSEAAPALSISKSDALQAIAEGQVARVKPRTTVVSVGANEGWPMTGADGTEHACCDEQWVDEYARRVRRTMLTYGPRVFWLTVVAQRGPLRAPIVAAVNTAILRAAEGLPEVHVVRLDELFTPNGYRETIRYRGRDVRVREPDGVHLNIAGARIAAAEVAKAVRAAGPAGVRALRARAAAPAGVRALRARAAAPGGVRALGPRAAGPARLGARAAAAADPCAEGPATNPLAATATRLGVIDLHFTDAFGVPVDFFECVGDRAIKLGTRSKAASTLTQLWAATTWRCGRLVRHFAATATRPDGFVRGIASIRTRSCAHRFDVTVPARVAPRGLARIRIADRWHVGGARTKLCVARPGALLACKPVVFRSGATQTRAVRVTKRGRWRVELRVAGHTTRATIAVGVAPAAATAPLPTLLATGDSMMDGLSGFLSDELGDERNVVSEVEPGIGISHSDAFQPMAVRLVKRLRPQTTVVAIGANEGWPMQGADGAQHECCDDEWVAEYTRRVRRTMQTLGRVFWLTLVGPKEARRVPIFAAVNTAILRAAEGLPDVRIVRMDQVFTPDGYQESISYDGRTVRVREPDGIHLNIAGNEIAAREVVKAIRAAGG